MAGDNLDLRVGGGKIIQLVDKRQGADIGSLNPAIFEISPDGVPGSPPGAHPRPAFQPIVPGSQSVIQLGFDGVFYPLAEHKLILPHFYLSSTLSNLVTP